MRKKIAMGLGLVLTVLTLTGCKELPVNENLEITPTAVSEVPDNEEEQWALEEGAVLRFRTSDKAFAEVAAALFKEKYGTTVNVEEGGAYDFTKGVLEGVAGEGPDVFMSPHDKTLEGIQAGIFLELDSNLLKSSSKFFNVYQNFF